MTVEQAKDMISFQTKLAVSSGEKIEQLEKENEKLKECIKMQENEVQELYESYERRLKPLQKENEELKAQIEYYKNGVADILNNADSEIGELRELLGLVYVDEKELDQLREKVKQQAEQIEKMKCCGNCNKLAFIISPCFSGCCKLDNHKTELKNNCDKWELAE